jgi:predicted Zn finger-like uncharacterized protein
MGAIAMIKVQCPSCTSPYDLDEGRLPAAGMKMRCPKCEAKFVVMPNGTTTPVDAPAAPAAPPAGPASASMMPAGLGGGASPPAAPGGPKQGPGVAPAGKMRKATMVGMSPVGGAAPTGMTKPVIPATPGAPPAAAAPKGPPAGLSMPAPLAPATVGQATVDPSGLDLPTPKKPAGPPPLGAVDLPAPKVGAPAPAKKLPPPSGLGSVDLPAVKAPGMGSATLAMGAHSPAAGSPAAGTSKFGEIDLPGGDADELDLGELGLGEIDLPAAKPAGGGFAPPLPAPAGLGAIDLPAPKQTSKMGGFAPAAAPPGLGEVDLPTPKGTAGLGDLPTPVRAGASTAQGVVDLPAPKSSFGMDLDLPVAKDGQNLPRVKDTQGGFGDLDLPVSKAGKDLPAPHRGQKVQGGGFGELDLSPPDAGTGSAGFGDVPGDFGGALPAAGEFDLPESHDLGDGPNLELPDLPDPAELTRDGRSGAGGVSFGELDLGSGGEAAPGMELEIPLDGGASSDMHTESPLAGFDGDALQIDEGAIEASKQALAADSDKRVRQSAVGPIGSTKRRAKRDYKKLAIFSGVVLVASVLAGGYLLQFTKFGLFGQFAIERYGPAAGSPAAADAAVKAAEKSLSLDTLADAKAAVKAMTNARNAASVNRTLLVNAAAVEGLYAQRFPLHKDGNLERLGRIMALVDERQTDMPHLGLARAANALANTKTYADARSYASAEPDGLFAALIEGEAALAAKDRKGARRAFEKALKRGGGAAAHWGIVRSRIGEATPEDLEKEVDATLAASPKHAEARVEKARLLLAKGNSAEAVKLLEEILAADAKSANKRAQSVAWTVLGTHYERERNRAKSRDAFEKAVSLDADNAEALVAAGRVMLEDNRDDDAFTRFEIVIKAGDDVPSRTPGGRSLLVDAKLGAAEALIRLKREQEAFAMMTDLAKKRPDDPLVILWLGKTEQAANELANAEQHYREAISLDKTSFIGYIALAELFFGKGEPDKAALVLQQASKDVSDNVEVRRMLGESDLQRDHIPEAIAHFQRALEIAPGDVESMFLLGVAQRRAGLFDEAGATLDQVMKTEPAWPGLATERGRVFESKGESGLAVSMYTDALKQNPDDIDLKLRLGAAQVLAGQMDEAEKTLLDVSAKLPRSGEAEHFLGRVAFARGDYEGASARFKRAINLDPARGPYYTYYAWVELERGNLSITQTQLERSIEIDPSQGEAFWVRGRLNLRLGAVKDALKSLEKAVALKPTLTDAYANIAECYSQLSRIKDAITAYGVALEKNAGRGDWWFELGKLQMNADKRADAIKSLDKSVEIGELIERKPFWVAEAHRWRGEAARLGRDMGTAKKSYLRYLELAPKEHVDRPEVLSVLRKMGVTPPEEE